MSKYFNTTDVTTKNLRTLICTFAKEQGVKKIIFSNRAKYVKGTYNSFTKIIYLNLDQDNKETMHALFHELGHHQAIKESLWTDYHFNIKSYTDPEEIFKIENGVDQIAEKLWYKYVDTRQWGNYMYAYPKASKKSIIKNFISTWYHTS